MLRAELSAEDQHRQWEKFFRLANIVGFVWIKPKEAKQLLLEMHGNRALRMYHALRLAREILGGSFGFTFDPLMFDTNGIPRTAQHRLAACVIANLPIPLFVIKNVSLYIIRNHDYGMAWKPHDKLQIPKRSSTVANAIYELCYGFGIQTQIPEIVDIVNQEFVKEIELLFQLPNKTRIFRAAVQTGVVLSLADPERNQTQVMDWCRAYLTSDRLGTTPLAWQIHEDYQGMRKIRQRAEIVEYIPKMFLALDEGCLGWSKFTPRRLDLAVERIKDLVEARIPNLKNFVLPEGDAKMTVKGFLKLIGKDSFKKMQEATRDEVDDQMENTELPLDK